MITANGYTIYFGEEGYHAVSKLLEKRQYSSVIVLADTNSNAFCAPHFLSMLATEIRVEIVEFDSGESHKTIETCVEIWTVLTELGVDRKSVIINLGGGVVSDLGGFVASTFKRGIDFINVPTTLLAMVDAAIGGKNGVDLGNLKNQVGLITSPQLIAIDTGYLTTLPQKEMRSGLAEMLKHGLIADRNYWDELRDLSAMDAADLDRLIHRSVEIKNAIVLHDPTENGIRKALNFGHTLGHAVESHFLEDPQKQPLLHGEAVAVGMVLESFISMEKKLLPQSDYASIKNAIKVTFGTVAFSDGDIQAIIRLLIHDKKNERGKVMFSLLDGIGRISIDHIVENATIESAFSDYKY